VAATARNAHGKSTSWPLPGPRKQLILLLFRFLIHTPDDLERVATLARTDQASHLHRLYRIAIDRWGAHYFIILQPTQDGVAAQRISERVDARADSIGLAVRHNWTIRKLDRVDVQRNVRSSK
jgi:hypothetical protein